MAPKKPTIADALARRSAAQAEPAALPTLQAAAPVAAVAPDGALTGKRAPSRVGMRQINVYVDPAVLKMVKQMALDMDRSQQSLMSEALNDFFQKHGKPRLADQSE